MSKPLILDHLAPEVKKDILELQQKIADFKAGSIIEDKFRAYRLTRGVYGQRQQGVQMFRIKLPFGRITAEQLTRIADISEKYTFGNLHLTTRQNIQLHHVKLEDSPAIWQQLAEVGVTAREACGNTVRNLTASAKAGIDPDELFDVSPYVYEAFRYFLRNPICQDMGRKIKPAFSASDKDSAFTYFHDFGFIPRIRHAENGEEIRGFKVVVGGGLGAQSIVAPTAYEFLHEDQIIPFMEAALRVFDRYGERAKRFKARMKFLVKKLGLEAFMALVEEERIAIKNKSYKIDRQAVTQPKPAPLRELPTTQANNLAKYASWYRTNVFEQKQKGWYAVQLRVFLGDIDAERARKLAVLVKNYAANDMRITVNQGLLIKYLRPETLPHFFNELDKLGLAEPGFNTIGDITACPGTDTCNLAVTNSTGLAGTLEQVIKNDFPHLTDERNISIKISGCMNSCGQHMAASIGFHGSSIRHSSGLIAPAMQIVLGGGVDPTGKGFIAEKIIKIPTKKIPDALRWLLTDYEQKSTDHEYFNDYFQRLGKRYFYNLLKPLANKAAFTATDFQDWGQAQNFKPTIGVGECAGVMYDVVGSIIADADEKVELAHESLLHEAYADGIYHAYSAFVIGAKALLLAKDVKCNTQKNILADFDKNYVAQNEISFANDTFSEYVLRINKNEPTAEFAMQYWQEAQAFLQQVHQIRQKQLSLEKADKLVIDNYYKA